jgi:hypothetical protein
MGIKANPNLHGSFFIKLESNFNYDGRAEYFWQLQQIKLQVTKLLSFSL